MSRPASAYSDDVTVYLVLNDHGQFDRHVTPGEKRPPAPSLRRGAEHALLVGGRRPAREAKKSPGSTGAFGVRMYCGPVLRHPAELIPAVDLGAPHFWSANPLGWGWGALEFAPT
jgi:hypothetical protein